MTRDNIAPLSGFVTFTPAQQAKFDQLKDLVARVHHAYGFMSLDLPLIYRTDALLAKSGGETDKQIYRLTKGDTELALRFDQTVPLAIFVAGHDRDIAFPLKVSQIGRVYRGEKVQRGREREFYQCDVDVIARGQLSVAYDAEVIAVAADIYRQMGLGDFTIRVANRRLLGGFLESLGLTNLQPVMSVIDDAEKVSETELVTQFKALNLTPEQIEKLQNFIKFSGSLDELVTLIDTPNALFQQGLAELTAVMEQLRLRQVPEAQVDLQIVRGLDYYTGTVFETRLNSLPEIGSIGSGGRYDNLVANYSNEQFEGVGFSIGLTRFFNSLAAVNQLPELPPQPKTLLIPVTPEQIPFCLATAANLRAHGETTDIYLQPGKLDKALTYAAKSGASYAIVIGTDEQNGKPFDRRSVVK
jgi:histidyl-tRNA synthetase